MRDDNQQAGFSDGESGTVGLPSARLGQFREDALREAALSHACRHRTSGETGKDVVKNAEVYLAFLRGESESGEQRGAGL